MKSVILVVLSLFPLFAKGQNYNCFPGGKQFFTSSGGYMRGIRIDSIKTDPDSTIYYPYHSFRGRYDASGWGGVNFTDSSGGSWVGKKVISYPDGTFLFDNFLNDTVIIKTAANPGDSWTFYSDTSDLHFIATVVSTDTASITGFTDSIKTILVRAYNASGPALAEPMDSSLIVLTQNHGFARLFELYTFPYHLPDSAYKRGLDFILDNFLTGSIPNKNNCSFFRTDFINPTTKQLHNWHTGDFWSTASVYGNYITGTQSYWFYETVAQAEEIAGAVVYTVTGTKDTCAAPYPRYNYPCNTLYPAGVYRFSDNTFPILDTSQLPEETICKALVFYYPYDTGFCRLSPSYKVIPAQYFTGGLGGYYLSSQYKLGFGMTSYSYADGEPTNESDYLRFGVFNSVSCNVPPHLESVSVIEEPIKVFPNPASANITIKSGSGIRSVVISDMLGRALLTKEFFAGKEEVQIDISNLAGGLYLLKLNNSIVTMLQKQE